MPRIALHTKLKPGMAADYERAHAVIPSELDQLLRQHGVTAWRIWRSGEDLFHEVEVRDWAQFKAAMAAEPVDRAWQERMNVFLDTTEGQSYQRELGQVWQLPES